jgi:uncharacterized iron-regulated membrane protein
MRFDQTRGLRLSMSWVHTWSGLVLGWLLFAIFVTGTLSFFRNEITFWMQPELHRVRTDELALVRAQKILEREAAGSPMWSISLPGARNPTLGLAWRAETPKPAAAADRPERGGEARGGREGRGGAAREGREARADRGEAREGRREARGEGRGEARGEARGARENRGNTRAGQGGRPEMKRLTLDPATSEILQARETAGGNFLYRFHFELHGLDRTWGRWIVGVATLFMLVAIVTGVIVHRNIFKDFFTFRPGKGKRSWLDAHNASSVLSLPFHIVITFSGLLLLGNLLLPSATQSAFQGDSRAYMQSLRGGTAETPPSGERAPLTDLSALLAATLEAWQGQPVGSITVTNPGDRQAVVELRAANMNSLTGGRGSSQTLRFDGVSGQPLDVPAARQPSIVQAIWNTQVMLHRGLFASPVPRWLLFLAGVGGSLMIASGLVMWSIARAKNANQNGKTPFGHRLVDILNVAGIAGLMVAIGAHFWANRLIPADLASRSDWEIRAFFIVWAATLVHALARKRKAAWVEQLTFAGTLIAALPILNAVTGGMPLFESLRQGQWLLAGFDLCALATGGGLLFAARKVAVHIPKVRAQAAKAAPDLAPAAAPAEPLLPSFNKLQPEEA